MDCSTPGLPVHHQLPEFMQTHDHGVGDAIRPSHPLSLTGALGAQGPLMPAVLGVGGSLGQGHTHRLPSLARGADAHPHTWVCLPSPLTLMVSSSMRRWLFSISRSLFLLSVCCSWVSSSASYSRLSSWNSRSSSCVFSALRDSQMSAHH